MGIRQDRDDAITVFMAAMRAQLAAAELIMTTVSTNTISAGQVTNLNAAIAAIRAALSVVNAPLRAHT